MASNTISLISSVSNEYSTLFKIKLNGEDAIVVGKQNFVFGRPYSEDFTEKHYNAIRTFDSFPKTYFTDRDDNKKKDVIIPSVNSQDIVQIGDRFISLNGLSNNPILYNGYANRFFGKYYYDFNQFVYAEFDSDLWSSLLTGGFDEQNITKLEDNKNLILEYLKEHYYNNDRYIDNSVLDDDQWGAALERRRSGYKSIQDVEGITLYSNPDFITSDIIEAPTNSYYEIDNTWIWNTVDASTTKPIYTNFSRFQNNLSPLSMTEIDFEAINKPKFRLWRKYNNIGKYDETNMWASYNLELPKKNDETSNLWKLGSEYQPVSNAYPNSDQFISNVGKDSGFIDGYSFAAFFDGTTLKSGEPLLELEVPAPTKDNPDNKEVIFSIGNSPHQQIYLRTEEENSTNNGLVHYNWTNTDNNALNPDNNYKDILNDIPNSSLITNAIDNTLNTYDNIHSSKVINYGTELTYETQSILNFNNIADEYITFELEYFEGDFGSKDITININSTTYRETFGYSKNATLTMFGNDGSLDTKWNKEYTLKEKIENSTEIDDDDNKSETEIVSETNESEEVISTTYKLQQISFTDINEDIVKLFIDDITFYYSYTENTESTDVATNVSSKINSLSQINIASIKIFEFDAEINDNDISTIQPINVYDISNGVIDNSSETYIYCDKSKYHYYYGIQFSEDNIDYSNITGLDEDDTSGEHIDLSYTYSTYLEDFYHHKLESDINLDGNIENENDPGQSSKLSTQFKVSIDNITTGSIEVGLNSSVTIPNSSSGNLTVKIQLPGIYSKYDFIKLFGAQFNISINSDYFKISPSPNSSNKKTITTNKNLVKTTYSDGSINCTLVGEGFDINSPLGSIIDYNGIVDDKEDSSAFNTKYSSMYTNLLSYTFDDNTNNYIPDHIKTNLRLNIERKVNVLSNSTHEKFTASDGTIQTLDLYGGFTYIINFISNKTNDYPIKITLNDPVDGKETELDTLSPNSNILTSKIDLSNETDKILKINFGDAQVFNNSNTNNISLIIEQYKNFISLDDNWFDSYTYIQHKTIEVSTTKGEIFDYPITAECCFVQDITNVNVPISFYSTNLKDSANLNGDGKIYEINLDECFYIGLQDMSDIKIDSNAAGNILHMYYIGFKSPIVFSNYKIKYSTLTDSGGTIATIKTYDSVVSGIYLNKNDIITSNITFTFDSLNKDNSYTIRYKTVNLDTNFDNYNALSRLWQGTSYYVSTDKNCTLTIGNCTYRNIDKSKTNIISTVNLPPDFKRILQISDLEDSENPNSVKIKLWPVYTNYFTNANYFTNSNVTPVQQSITFDTKLNIDYIENLYPNTISFEHSDRLREFLTYRTVPFISIDNIETTIDNSNEFNLINEEQSFFISEPVIDKESDEILKNLNYNNNYTQSNVYGVKFGGFSIYGDRINVRKPQLHQSFIDTLTSVGFSVVFNNDETLVEGSEGACTLNVFVNGKLISNTSYTKGSATDKFYKSINFGSSTVKFGKNSISRLNYVRSFNYAVNDSMFNLLHTKYRNYENIENTANIIYDYSIYDDISLYGDWQQTDDSIFSKQILNISPDMNLDGINLRDYVIAVRFSPYQYKANYFNTIYTNAVDLENLKDSYNDDERLYLIKDFDFIDRISGLNRLNNGEGKASNLYSLKITNSGFNTNNYDPINQPEDYKLQDLINNTCRTSLENAIATITQKFQPINTQLFKVIYDDPGFTS